MTGFDNPLSRQARPGYPEATRRLKGLVRAMLRLDDDVAVSVSELACFEPGCPDLETVIGILSAGSKPRIGRVHKRIPEIDASDVETAFAAPPAEATPDRVRRPPPRA